MPTSISHIGGRARVNEPGRYKKKNNKNLTAQGLPTYIGMPQPLRNLIAKRVKTSEAISKKKGSTVNYGKLVGTFTIQTDGEKTADFWGTSRNLNLITNDDSNWEEGFYAPTPNAESIDPSCQFLLRWTIPTTEEPCGGDAFKYRINGNGSSNDGVNPGLLPNTQYLITVFKDVDNVGTFNATTDANRTMEIPTSSPVPDSISFIKSDYPPNTTISEDNCPACNGSPCPTPTTGFPAWFGETIQIYIKKA